tara:strand:- start:77 stop:844 length:768 start_codon:yes stop_codon:yes gene_type:complete
MGIKEKYKEQMKEEHFNRLKNTKEVDIKQMADALSRIKNDTGFVNILLEQLRNLLTIQLREELLYELVERGLIEESDCRWIRFCFYTAQDYIMYYIHLTSLNADDKEYIIKHYVNTFTDLVRNFRRDCISRGALLEDIEFLEQEGAITADQARIIYEQSDIYRSNIREDLKHKTAIDGENGINHFVHALYKQLELSLAVKDETHTMAINLYKALSEMGEDKVRIGEGSYTLFHRGFLSMNEDEDKIDMDMDIDSD